MKLFLRFGLPLLVAGLMVMPTVVSAQATYLPFGGRIGFIIPCLNATIYTVVISARNIDPGVPGPYIYDFKPTPLPTMDSITPPIGSIPPTYLGEQILGTWQTPTYCVLSYVPFIALPGFRMQTENVDASSFVGV